jgi:hypothetical protein
MEFMTFVRQGGVGKINRGGRNNLPKNKSKLELLKPLKAS